MPEDTGHTHGLSHYDPDGDLVVRIAQGDHQAASELVMRHLPKMVALANHMLADATEAEDIAQEVFVKVWKHAHKWQPGVAKFETWMHRVAINLCYDRLRRRREIYTDQIPDREDKNTPKTDQGIIDAQLSAHIEGALQRLPPRQRAAITLCHLREMSNIEAADSMQVSVEAMESLLARGRKGLRKLLAGQAAELLESEG